MRLLVTGDRNWDDRKLLIATLDDIHTVTPITLLIEGCASGADQMSGNHPPVFEGGDAHGKVLVPAGWAWARGVPGEHHPALWVKYGRAAGVYRNQEQLDIGRPDRVVAFHHDLSKSKGTADMVRRAKVAGVPVLIVA